MLVNGNYISIRKIIANALAKLNEITWSQMYLDQVQGITSFNIGLIDLNILKQEVIVLY